MSLTALRRTAAGAAVLATAVAGAAAVPTSSASADAGPAATSITIRALHGAVRPGGTDTITGALLVAGPGTAAGRTVTLEARPMGSDTFTPVGDAVAADRGGVRESVAPAAPRHPDQHLALDPRRAPRGTARRCGHGARPAPRRADPAPAPSRDPGVAHERRRLVDLRGRAPDPSSRCGRVQGRAHDPDGVPPRSSSPARTGRSTCKPPARQHSPSTAP